MTGRFDGETVVITGAASGIGLATAHRFLSEGANVLAVDRNEDALAELANSNNRDPACLQTLDVDVAAGDAPDRIAEETLSCFGQIDMLVNNAGVGGSTPLHKTSDDDLERILSVNLISVVRLSRKVLEHLPRPGGRIVNISSIFGLTGFQGTSAYAISKAGVAQLTRQMAADYSAEGIRVNAVAPGIISTPMVDKRLANDDWFNRAMKDTTPAGRVGTPEDIAGVVTFLCSDDAAFIAGQNIVVDGGWLATHFLPE